MRLCIPPPAGPSGGKAGSLVGSKGRAPARGGGGDDARSIASSYLPRGGGGGSAASYPRTPQFSAAGSAVDAEIGERLAFLERALREEKQMRWVGLAEAEGGKGRRTPWVYWSDRLGRFVRTVGNVAQPYLRPALKQNGAAIVAAINAPEVTP